MIEVKNTFGLRLKTDPITCRDTIAKAFNVSADKFFAYGPLCGVSKTGRFVNEDPPARFMIVTDEDTANEMKKQRPADVTIHSPKP
jgi:hypothetical protein